MSDIQNVPIKVFGSQKEYSALDVQHEPQIAEIVRNHVLARSDKEYLRVNVKIRRHPDRKPKYLVAYLLRKDVYTAEVVRIDVDDAFQVTGLTHDYSDSADEEERPAVRKQGYAAAYNFVVGSPVAAEIPTAKLAVEKIHELATAAGLRSKMLKDSEASLANYEQYLTSNLAGFVNIGHGNTSCILLDDGVLDVNWFKSVAFEAVNPEVIYFNSCQVFNPPLEPAIMQAGARTFIGGKLNLAIGASEEVCKCFWGKAFTWTSNMGDALHQCEISTKYPTPGAHGIGGYTGPFYVDRVGLPPALEVFQGKLYMVWKGMESDDRIFYTSFDGYKWDTQHLAPGISTSSGVALAVFDGKLFMAWKGRYDDQRIFWTTFNGSTWAPQQQVPGVATSHGPRIAVIGNKVYMAWKGMVNDERIFWSTFDGKLWAPQTLIPNVATSVGPAIAVFNNTLYMVWKGWFDDQGLYWSKFTGSGWAPQQKIAGVGSSQGPSLAVFKGKLYGLWKGVFADQSLWYSFFDGAAWGPQKQIAGVASSVGPGAAVYHDALYAAWKGMLQDQRIWFSNFNGATWQAQQVVPGVATSPDLALAAATV